MIPDCCGRHCCRRCGRSIGFRIRARLGSVLDGMEECDMLGRMVYARMWTLTIDPSGYGSPEEAHAAVSARKSISDRLARRFGWKHYVWVMELHSPRDDPDDPSDDPRRWPHWHLVVFHYGRPPFECKHEVQEVWSHGNVYYSDRHPSTRKRYNPRTAAKYVTKYMTKPDPRPLPRWVLDSKRMVWIRASRALGRIVARRSDTEPTKLPPGTKRHYRMRTIGESIRDCGSRVVLLRKTGYRYVGRGGEVLEVCRTKHLARAAIPYRTLCRLAVRIGASEFVARNRARISIPDHNPLSSRLQRVLPLVH